MESSYEEWVAASDELADARSAEPFQPKRYAAACAARIALIHAGFNVDYLIPRGREP